MRAALFDMDGVVYNSEKPIPGAVEALSRVRDQGIPYLFVTNTTSRGRAALVEKLAGFGIQAKEADIMTPCVVAAEWLRRQEQGRVALFVRPKARAEFGGLACVPEEAETGAQYVVVGDMGELWDFRTLNRAFRLLYSNPDSTLIALGMTRFWQAQDGATLDTAPFVAALERATGRKAIVFGKPAAAFFLAAAHKLGVPAGEILMVGDDIETDVGGAQRAGMKGALVKTGKFREHDLRGQVKPDAVLDSIAAVPGLLERQA